MPRCWENEFLWVMGAKGQSFISIIKRITWGATIYHLWRQRNSRIHENDYSSGEAIFHLICNDVKLRVACLKEVEDNHANRVWCERWSFPLSLVLVDRPYDRYPRRVVCGFLLVERSAVVFLSSHGMFYVVCCGCMVLFACLVSFWSLPGGLCLFLGSMCPGCGLCFYWCVLLMKCLFGWLYCLFVMFYQVVCVGLLPLSYVLGEVLPVFRFSWGLLATFFFLDNCYWLLLLSLIVCWLWLFGNKFLTYPKKKKKIPLGASSWLLIPRWIPLW